MGVFRSITPAPTQPGERYNDDREARHIRSTEDAKAVLEALINSLASFRPVQFTSREGKILRALAQDLGLDAEVDGQGAEVRPWQPYLAPDLGSGVPPAGQGRKIMLRPGSVSDGINVFLPARPNLVYTVPPNCTEGFYVWLVVHVGAGGQIISLDNGSGTELPAPLLFDPSTDDTLPPIAYDLLLAITSTADAVELDTAVSMRRGPLTMRASLNGGFGPRVEFLEL